MHLRHIISCCTYKVNKDVQKLHIMISIYVQKLHIMISIYVQFLHIIRLSYVIIMQTRNLCAYAILRHGTTKNPRFNQILIYRRPCRAAV